MSDDKQTTGYNEREELIGAGKLIRTPHGDIWNLGTQPTKTAEKLRSAEQTTRGETHFINLVKEHGAHAVPLPDGSATAWAGAGIRALFYERRERIGNALLAAGRLRFGESIPGSNSVRIEVIE